jgi:hypothetical protein
VPDGHCARVDTVPESRDDPTDDKLRDPIRRSLQCRTDTEDSAAQHDGSASPEHLAEEEGEQGAEKTPDLVDRHHRALEGGGAVSGVGGVCVAQLRVATGWNRE